MNALDRAAGGRPGGDRALAGLAAIARAADTEGLLRAALERYAGRAAVVASFGAESAVLLHLVAGIDRTVPVIFLDTGKLFPETLAYRDSLRDRLGLADVRSVRPDAAAVAAADPGGDLWRRDPDRCCALRKIAPLARALSGVDLWINGRKRYHGAVRRALPPVERVGGRLKLNPLADWSENRIDAYFRIHDLPRHPLQAEGYASIGCVPCTTPVAPGEDGRAGRWRDSEKTECGIHFVGDTFVHG